MIPGFALILSCVSVGVDFGSNGYLFLLVQLVCAMSGCRFVFGGDVVWW
jgi:hypothetical protein